MKNFYCSRYFVTQDLAFSRYFTPGNYQSLYNHSSLNDQGPNLLLVINAFKSSHIRELTPGFICKILFLGSTSGTGSCQGSISKPVLGDDRFELIKLQEELRKWRSVRGVEGSEQSPASLSSQAQLGKCNYEGVICKDVCEMLLPLCSFFLCRTTARRWVVDLFPDGHQDRVNNEKRMWSSGEQRQSRTCLCLCHCIWL